MILKIGQIAPDDVAVEIPWDDWSVDASVFVPCVNTDLAIKQLRREAKERGMKIECRIRIEKYFGIRAWRIS